MEIKVVKIGGNIIDNEAVLEEFLDMYSRLPDPKVLIHGGGKLATAMCKKMGIETQMVEGRRITDSETLKIATMVYAGWINKKIVAGVHARGKRSIGLCGADSDIIRAAKRPVGEIDYGWVGDVEKVDAEALLEIILLGLSPVLSAITHDGRGQLLNTNADTVAAETASALARLFAITVNMYYCFEKQGVLTDLSNEESYVPHITPESYARLREQGIVSDGMIPKLDNAFYCLKNGVKAVYIGRHDKLLADVESPVGTKLSAK